MRRGTKRKRREHQARANKQIQRCDYNYLSLNSSTPIKNADIGTATQGWQTEGVHFNPNTVQHYYSTTGTTRHMGHYEPPVNDTIIQTAATAPTEQLTSNRTMGMGHNEAYRNIGTAPQNHNNFPPRMTSRNGLFNNSPNSS